MTQRIENVADTAFWVATYRADEGKRADALFSDPLAERLVAGRGREIASNMWGGAFTAWMVVIRTRIIDDYILQAVADGFDTVLNLGAGLDTRPYRMELPSTLRWIEVDFASTIDFKDEKLAREKPRCQVERRKVDLGDAQARRALLADVNAQGKRILVLTEGVVPYLTNDAVRDLASDLLKCEHVERWVLEYLAAMGLLFRQVILRRRNRQLSNAPFVFDPGDWHVFFGKLGWKARDIRYVTEEGKRLRRMPPLPMWMRVLFRLIPSRQFKRMSRTHGYALLERS